MVLFEPNAESEPHDHPFVQCGCHIPAAAKANQHGTDSKPAQGRSAAFPHRRRSRFHYSAALCPLARRHLSCTRQCKQTLRPSLGSRASALHLTRCACPPSLPHFTSGPALVQSHCPGSGSTPDLPSDLAFPRSAPLKARARLGLLCCYSCFFFISSILFALPPPLRRIPQPSRYDSNSSPSPKTAKA